MLQPSVHNIGNVDRQEVEKRRSNDGSLACNPFTLHLIRVRWIEHDQHGAVDYRRGGVGF